MIETEEHPDLFPDLPRVKVRKLSNRDQMKSELIRIQKTYGVTMKDIAEKVLVPLRTLEGWFYKASLPPEWACRLLRMELWKAFPPR